ncbi:hypothetical protein CHS0354_027567 [Potamilus streckersoni]|uniref:HEPN domain-containing protein n=1 Tax=Potamilus streckersoni TaxID=2493646 RepID=A0AAE0VMJ8_9BIVA|nr:hypothetical protein CHS0354_027567 [Potamilus streckersoni]
MDINEIHEYISRTDNHDQNYTELFHKVNDLPHEQRLKNKELGEQNFKLGNRIKKMMSKRKHTTQTSEQPEQSVVPLKIRSKKESKKKKRRVEYPETDEDEEVSESTEASESDESSDENGSDQVKWFRMIRPSLIKDLKNILSEYPDDGQIIKEFLQNAEDAGATEVKMLLAGKCCNHELSTQRAYKKFFKGPGLCVYNNAEFTEEDWKGICMLNSSVKEKDPIKVGRFGLGFKSVFHITGNNIHSTICKALAIDDCKALKEEDKNCQETCLSNFLFWIQNICSPYVSVYDLCIPIHYDYPCIISGEQLLLLNPHEPEDRVCNVMKLYDMSKFTQTDCLEALNNVFGFSAMVLKKGYYKGTLFWFPLRNVPTDLSDTTYTTTKVLDLFKSFQTDASSILIFLKSLVSVDLFCSDTGTQFDHGMVNPFFRVEIKMDPDSMDRKTKFIDQVLKLNGGYSDSDLDSCRHVCVTITDAQKENEAQIIRVHWTVVDFYKGGEMSDTLKRLSNEKSLSYIPYVGVATCESFNDFQNGGHIFCFMPLPQERKSLTGLPVHINGLFALSRNRRHLKWSSSEQESQGLHIDNDIQWNQCLVQEILPSAYCLLIQEMVTACGNEKEKIDLVYAVFPVLTKVDKKWSNLVDRVKEKLWNMTVLFTQCHGGKWITPGNALFSSFNHYQSLSKKCKEAVKKTLTMYDQNWVDVPQHVGSYFINKPGILDLSPKEFCKILKTSPKYCKFGFEEKVSILEFLVADADYHKLKGLHLLPLQDGNFASFRSRDDCHDKIFLANPSDVDLFPKMENMFLHLGESTQQLGEHFRKMANLGIYQLYELTPGTSFLNLLQETLEKNFGNKYPVQIQASNSNFTLLWIEKVWKYLIKNNIQLKLVEEFPLVPGVGEGKSMKHLTQLKLYHLKDHLILENLLGMSSLTKDLCEALQNLSITVLFSLPAFITFQHVQAYIRPPTQASVLNIFTNIQNSGKLECIDHFNRLASASSRTSIAEYLSKSEGSDWNEQSKKFVQKLELFQEVVSLHVGKIKCLVAADDIKFQCPVDKFPVKFPCRLIVARSDAEANLASLIGVERMSKEDLMKKTLKTIQEGQYSEEEVVNFMTYLIDNFNKYKKCSEITRMARSVSFLRNSALKLCRPDELFDPWDEDLKELFYNEDRFPRDHIIAQSNRRQALTDFGLRSKQDIRASDLLETAKILDSLSSGHVQVDALCRKGRWFMKILNDTCYLSEKIDGKELAFHIKNLKCVLHKSSPANSYPKELIWYGQAAVLSKPTDIRSSQYSNSVGSAMSFIDCEDFPTLANYFKWNTSPPGNKVYEHLRHLIANQPKLKLPTMLHILLDIYTELNKLYICPGMEMERPNFPCIWYGKGFTIPRNVYISENEDLNLGPYLYRLPVAFSHYDGLFEWMGCHSHLTPDVLLEVQQKVNEKHEQHRKSPLLSSQVRSDRQLIIRILEVLKEHGNQLGGEEGYNILFPVQTEDDSQLVLKPGMECIYSTDQNWLWNLGYIEEEGLFHIHKDVSITIAKELGIKSLQQNLMSSAVGIDYEEWGQEESLTRRIHNLLEEGYTDGFSVPKEIIQNADDAHATEVYFLYDERENHESKTKLLDVGMAKCQGPALWAYNNSKFSPEDLKNLTKLSGATKANDTTKIGKFGLGFCSVYNLTDVPSLITGYDIVFYDPHKTHLGKALPGSKPGLKISLTSQKNRKLLKLLDHQFKPFQGIFGCTLKEDSHIPYEGTLFRFPFRTTKRSEIKPHPYSKEDRIELIKKFIEYGGNILLFTQNVVNVKLFHLAKESTDPTQMKLLYSIKKIIQIDPLLSERKSVLEKMTDHCKSSKDLCTNQFKAIQRISIRTFITKEASHLIPVLKQRVGDVETEWLISWTSGRNECLKLMTMMKTSVVPLGAVALLINKDEKNHIIPEKVDKSPFGFYKESHFFCFLPMPLGTKLPVHINATFAVTSDRKQLRVFTQDENQTIESQWNDALLGDAVCNAYLNLLKYLREISDISNKYDCFLLWPCHSSVSCLETNFYRMLVTENWELFRGKVSWAAFSNCLFLAKALTNKKICEISLKTLSEFKKTKTDVVINLPDRIRDLLEKSHKQQLTQRTVKTKSFIKDIFFPNIKSPFWKGKEKDRNKMILHIISERDNDINNAARHIACIPTKPNGDLKMPTELVHPEKDIAKMFSNIDGRFPIKEFKKKNILAGLVEWGMMKSKITSDLLEDRCWSVSVLVNTGRQQSLQRYRAVMSYLEKLNREKSLDKETLSKISKIAFLPVMSKPSGWPFKWKAEEALQQGGGMCSKRSEMLGTFARADQMFSKKYYNIISCSELILDVTESDSLNICFQLGLQDIGDNELSFAGLEKQLLTISETLQDQEGNSEVLALTQRICQYIYAYFDRICLQKQWARERLTKYRSDPVIFIENKFVAPIYTYSKHLLDCKPEFYRVQDFDNYKHFYSAVGVKSTLPPPAICQVLTSMKEEWKNEKLSNQMLQLALNLLHCLAESLKESDTCKTCLDLNIVGIDNNDRLTPVSQLCFDDRDIKSRNKMRYVHPDISENEGNLLGIKTKKKKILNECSKKIAFGQHEDLLNRLIQILEKYPCDFGILKELLQNADDAGATEVHFIKDYRHLKTNKIFDDCFAPLQGPALSVFNNSSFTQTDLEGIQKLGLGSKGNDKFKTGQYGVGFNVVYHLTDVPSFLTKGPEIETGQSLCFLDPMCQYITDATQEQPGMRYIDLEDLRDSCSDVFEGYLEKTFFSSENGTLFRFPLRDRQMAKVSQISASEMSTAQVDKLLEGFKDEIFTALLFVKNVTKIVYSKVNKNGKVVIDYKVEASLSKEDKERRTSFFQSAKPNASDVTDTLCSRFETDYILKIKDNKGKSQVWHVFQNFGFGNCEHFPSNMLEAVKAGFIKCLPVGGVAGHHSSSIECHDQPSMAGKAFCFLPLPIDTGLPVHINGHLSLDDEGRRSLWRDKMDARTTWNSLLLRYVVSPAYVRFIKQMRKDLLPDKVVQKSVMKHQLTSYFKLFPLHTNSKDDYWKDLTKWFYECIVQNEEKVFPLVQKKPKELLIKWIPVKTIGHEFPSYFDIENIPRSKEIVYPGNQYQTIERSTLPKLRRITTVLKDIGMQIVHSNIEVYESMIESGLHVSCLTPEAAMGFLKSHFSSDEDCTLSGIGEDVSQSTFKDRPRVLSLLYFCARSDRFITELDGLPLLVANDKSLHVFSKETPVFFSQFADLHTGSARNFLHPKLVEFFLCKFQNQSGSQIDIWQIGIFKKLDIQQCMQILECTLSAYDYRQQNYIEWIPSSVKQLNMKWISRFWDFIKEQVEENVLSKNENISDFLNREFEQHNDWCLVPAIVQHNHSTKFFLVPLSLAYTVFDFETIENPMLRRVFDKLVLPTICSTLFRVELNMEVKIIQTLVSQTTWPSAVLKGLFFHKEEILRKKNLTDNECTVILEYFCQQMEKEEFSHNTENIKLLKSLPLFLIHTGRVTSLEHYSKVVIAPYSIPVDGLDEWMLHQNICFLKKIEKLSKLHKMVAIDCETHEEFYCNFIIPMFSFLPNKDELTHLKYIRDFVLYKQLSETYTEKQKMVISMLKRCDFISLGDGRRKACDFFSPFVNVFVAMCKDNEFPPPPFRNEDWKHFMKLVGMVSEVTADQFCKFAEDLSRMYQKPKDVPDELARKSQILCEHLFSNESNVLGRVSSIKFIPPFKVDNFLGDIFPQNSTCPISFSNSLSSKFANIAWTCCQILPDFAFPASSYIQEQLNILPQPQLQDVITHTENICEALKFDQSHGKYQNFKIHVIDSVLPEIYQFLMTHGMQMDVLRDRLHRKPILLIPDGPYFVHAEQVVRDGEEIRPYLFRYPMEYGRFYDLFRYLGTAERANINHYASVLNLIHEKCGMNKLLPNEISIVKNALEGLVCCFEDSDNESLKISIDSLYLPSEKWSMVNAIELIVSNHKLYRDKVKAFENLKFFCGFRKLGLCGKNEKKIFSKFPKQWRPKFLSNIVIKRLDKENSDLFPIDSEESRLLQRFLTSKEVLTGLMRLLQNENKALEEETVRSNLANVVVQQVRVICTCLNFQNEKLSGKREESWINRETEENRIQLYFTMQSTVQSQQIFEKLQPQISVIFNSCTDKLLQDKFNHLITIAKCVTAPERIAELLDEAEICNYEVSDKFSFQNMDSIPQLGAYVPEKFHAMLDNAFVLLDIGEIVAYEIEDKLESGNPVFVFAKVLKRVDSTVHSSEIDLKYDIDIGSEIKTVMTIFLYQFIRKEVDIKSLVIRRTSPSTKPESSKPESFKPESSKPESSIPESSNQLKEVKNKIRKMLQEAWTKDEEEKKQIIKRLCLKWHPDKNYGNEQFCTKVFQYIQHLISKFEKGQFEDSDSDDDASTKTRSESSRSSRSSHSKKTSWQGDSNWKSFFNFMGRRAREHRHQYESYSQADFSCPNFSAEPSPQPKEAQRWQNQARLDLAAAKVTLRFAEDHRLHNWVCYQCHQAAEKSLKGARFAIDGNNVPQHSHQLDSIASGLSNVPLIEIARQLQAHVGEHTCMRYPDRFSAPSIPADYFKRDDSTKAFELATQILNLVDEMLEM